MLSSLSLNGRPARSVGSSLVFAAIWVVAAALRPELTFHLAPLIVAGAAPVILALEARGVGNSEPPLAAAGLLATGLAVAATGGLSAAGWLEGPSLLPTGGAALEAAMFALAGGTAGWTIATGMVRSSI